MRKHTKILARSVVLAAAALFVGCNSTIDDEPNVVLEMENVIIPAVTGAIDSQTNVCAYTVTPGTATFKNKPKNALAASSPFNDIVLQNVTVNYAWDDLAGVSGPTVFGIGGTVPANGTATGQFTVINAQDVTTPDRGGHTASLLLTFHGVTVSGEPVSVTTGGTLTVNTCQ